MNSKNARDGAIIETVRFYFAQCVFNHQVYENATSREKHKETILKIINLILTTITLVALAAPDKENDILKALGAISGIAEVVAQLIQWSFGIGEHSKIHRKTADAYRRLRDEYLCLISDYKSGIDIKDVRKRRDELMKEYCEISENALESTMRDYRKAQVLLHTNGSKTGQIEANIWSKEEIDRFLPENLR